MKYDANHIANTLHKHGSSISYGQTVRSLRDAYEAGFSAKVDVFRSIAGRLWQLLDDIDTMDDAAKSDDAAYRRGCQGIQNLRNKYAVSLDGHELTWIVDEVLPGETGAETMSRILSFMRIEPKCSPDDTSQDRSSDMAFDSDNNDPPRPSSDFDADYSADAYLRAHQGMPRMDSLTNLLVRAYEAGFKDAHKAVVDLPDRWDESQSLALAERATKNLEAATPKPVTPESCSAALSRLDKGDAKEGDAEIVRERLRHIGTERDKELNRAK